MEAEEEITPKKYHVLRTLFGKDLMGSPLQILPSNLRFAIGDGGWKNFQKYCPKWWFNDDVPW